MPEVVNDWITKENQLRTLFQLRTQITILR
jgi:hypothetical protein